LRGGAVLVSGLGNPVGLARSAKSPEKSFLFFQLSDTHRGFNGPKVNQARYVISEFNVKGERS
jgi:hypothetical protein